MKFHIFKKKKKMHSCIRVNRAGTESLESQLHVVFKVVCMHPIVEKAEAYWWLSAALWLILC